MAIFQQLCHTLCKVSCCEVVHTDALNRLDVRAQEYGSLDVHTIRPNAAACMYGLGMCVAVIILSSLWWLDLETEEFLQHVND